VGTHDFRAFRTDPGPTRRGEDTVRRVDRVDVLGAADLVYIDVEGPGFLYMMVRNMAAALVEVGSLRRPPQWVLEVLAARQRARLPPAAPAAGLSLVRVSYA
jgi:tRNA pseudouridine38-40 synthase